MKKLLHFSATLFGVCSVLLARPATSVAVTPGEPPVAATRASILNAKPSLGYRDRVVYVISDQAETGSHIPTVFRVYHGTIMAIGSMNRSTYYNLRVTGQENVASALGRIDPSVTVNGGHR